MEFELDEFFWVAKTKLVEWAGFQDRRGPYGSKSSASPSDGVISIVFAPEGRDTHPLNTEEIELAEWFLQNHQAQAKCVLQGIFGAYPSIRTSYLEAYGDEVVSDILPEIVAIDDLRTLIGLQSVNIHQLSRSGIPYVGYEFGCEWDQEHGLGVLMHGNRVVEMGGVDTAILLWIAEKDAQSTVRS